jgi:hypothetical protein
MSRSSVEEFPLERTNDMIRDRSPFVSESAIRFISLASNQSILTRQLSHHHE